MIALNTGKHEYEIIEEALREYVDARREDARRDALTLLDQIAGRHEELGDQFGEHPTGVAPPSRGQRGGISPSWPRTRFLT